MAPKESFDGRGSGRLTAWLAVPRVVTFPLLLALGMGAAELAWRLVDSVKILAWVSGMAAPFCMICATAVWAMRDRMDEAINTDQMSSSEFRQFDRLVASQRTKSTTWAAVAALMALLASAPAVSNQLIGPIWHWMALACGGAIAGALYTYMLANYWEEQIRAYKSRRKLLEKQRDEKAALMDAIETGTGSFGDRGWAQGPTLNPPTAHH